MLPKHILSRSIRCLSNDTCDSQTCIRNTAKQRAVSNFGLRVTSTQQISSAACRCERHSSIFAVSANASWQQLAWLDSVCQFPAVLKQCQPWSSTAYCASRSNRHTLKVTEGVGRRHFAESAVTMASKWQRGDPVSSINLASSDSYSNSVSQGAQTLHRCARREIRSGACLVRPSILVTQRVASVILSTSHASHMRQRRGGK